MSEQEKAAARQRRIVTATILSLQGNENFVLWVADLVEGRCGLRDVLRTDSVADFNFHAGRRSVASEIIAQFERHSPGFHERLLAARRKTAQELGFERAEPAEESSDGNADFD